MSQLKVCMLNYTDATLIGKASLRIHQHEIGTHIIRKLLCM